MLVSRREITSLTHTTSEEKRKINWVFEGQSG